MFYKAIKTRFCSALAAGLVSLGTAHSALSQAQETVQLAQTPLFLSQPVRPIVMLNMSNDHQLYFKAYDDYSDLTKDGVADTTYVHSHDYYGYFDSGKCYKYQNSRFEPIRVTESGYCNGGGNSGEWSGNFLNWATMTRIDVVRKILYGGYRSTDSDSATVLERALLPNDAHSFAKYYNGTDIPSLTPFSRPDGLGNKKNDGLTICNTTEGSGFSQSVDTSSYPPLMRVARGNYSLWASNERWQCRWGLGSNANDPAKTEIDAYSSSPVFASDKLGEDGDYNVRVKACVSGLLEENCRSYPSGSVKSAGLLQKYGEKGEILFGLMTGSYAKNKSGGVLRKNANDLTDEINETTDGTFVADANGIIKTLDSLRIYGYRYSGGAGDTNGTYGDSGGDKCPFGLTGFSDGTCSNWGNPQSEIYLESLRYLAGKSASYSANDSTYISGLPTATWTDPLDSDNYCAPLNIIQFNASSSSYDGDTTNDLGVNVAQWTDNVGAGENIHTNNYFVGTSGADNNQLCTGKTVTALSGVTGTCPDAPRLEGTYNIAGMSYYARKNDIRDFTGDQTVRTYGVALASATPSITVPVPERAGKVVNILPACQNTQTDGAGRREGNCAIVDFTIVSQTLTATANSGKLYVNWEAAEQGGDYDSDMWGILTYTVTSSGVRIDTEVMDVSSGRPLDFGYVLSGTSDDGYHAQSGVNKTFEGASCIDPRPHDNSSQCIANGDAQTYTFGSSTSSLLQSPLYYAAKWGGYGDDGLTATQIAAATPETYFFAIDPSELEAKLKAALDKVASDVGSSSAVATNSTRLGTDTVIYQALFNSADWSGEIKAIKLQADGSPSLTPEWSTKDADTFAAYGTRNIYTYTDKNGDGAPEYLPFTWDNLSAADKTLLSGNDGDTIGQARLEWIRGRDVSGMRERTTVLGDIVNANPVYAGRKNYRFDRLSNALGGGDVTDDQGVVTNTYTSWYDSNKKNRTEVLYVNANDGMLHGFNADTGNETFAYIPSGAYNKLKNMTAPNYGSPASNPHKYSVDGPLFVGDAYFNLAWHNVLVGTYGAGGKGLFALDVTNPASPSLLFELDENTPVLGPDIGNILGQPLVAPTARGWKIIFGNGYNSANGKAKLIIVDLGDPTDIEVIATDGSGSNGLAGPSLLTNSEGVVTRAYAGDLQGNMWKFAVGNNDNWNLAFTHGGNKYPLFKAQDGAGNNQPITAAPTLGLNSQMNNAIMVYFGTGRYLTSTDNSAGTVINSFYAIADTGSRVAITDTDQDDILDRDSQLLEKVIAQSNGVRTVSNNTNKWWEATEGNTAKRGWYMDLIPSGAATPTGERVISKPLLLFDRLLFPTLITSSNACAFGGSGWQMELVAVGDKHVGHSIFGEDGTELTYAVIGYSELIRAGEKAYLPSSNIKGEIKVPEGTLPSDAVGRMSWRQLR